MTSMGAIQKSNKSKRTKQLILNTFLSLIRIKEWDKITVKELCLRAEITRGTFYLYYNDIYDLMEYIETTLLDELIGIYSKTDAATPKANTFHYSAPKTLLIWFDFCKNHKNEMLALLHPQNGDDYFIKKVRGILSTPINEMMDQDGMPRDELRNHFCKIFLDLHFTTVLSVLESDADERLETHQMVDLLNTMRVGARCLSDVNSKAVL